jgi:hypothetical protein
MTMEEIRERYPNPIRAEDEPDDPLIYCVGGACILAAGISWTIEDCIFPDRFELMEALCQLNPALSKRQATCYADNIIIENDMGRFANAWEAVAQALKDSGEPAAPPVIAGGQL